MSNAVAWRTARLGDAAAVRELTRRAYAKWVPVIGREPLPMTADYEMAVAAHRIDLAERESVLLGLVELVLHPDALLIENVAVSPEHQKQGLGRLLMARAETVAAELQYRLIKLYTNKAFAENVAFYERLGYGIDREEPFRGGTTVYMSKRLSA
ncbi:GNAT family N-acetyltransferase [Consotaella aegiceratis]|uniref:GNAT family N-acetyltransferase n=1 Tax=Consotaella aegiceratis TaxID=3097961 RepID=UPI002F3E7B53